MNKTLCAFLFAIAVFTVAITGCGGGGGGGGTAAPPNPGGDTAAPVVTATKPQAGESVSDGDFCHVSQGAQVVTISYSDASSMNFSSFSASVTSTNRKTDATKTLSISSMFSKISETTIQDNSTFEDLCGDCSLPEDQRLFCFSTNDSSYDVTISFSVKDVAGNSGSNSISFTVTPADAPPGP